MVGSAAGRSRAARLEPLLDALAWIVLIFGILGSVILLITGIGMVGDPVAEFAGIQLITFALVGALNSVIAWAVLPRGSVAAGYVNERSE